MNMYLMLGSSITLAILTIMLIEVFESDTNIENERMAMIEGESMAMAKVGEEPNYIDTLLPYIASISIASIAFIIIRREKRL